MRIMCLNGWGGARHAALTRYVASVSPDILCLQEVSLTPTADKDWLTYRDGQHILPQRANFFADVAAALPDHSAQFCPTAQGVLWDKEIALASQFGIATFTHKHLPIIAQAQAFVHGAYSPHGYGDHPRARNAHAVRIYDHEDDRVVTVAHMHGLRDLRGKMDTPERSAQARRLDALVRRVAEPQDAIIVCGDFNVEPDSETLTILAASGLTDLVTTRGFTSTRTSLYKKPGRFADYMLVNGQVTVDGFDVVEDPEVSDHCPLLLTL